MKKNLNVKKRYIFARYEAETGILYSGCHSPQLFLGSMPMRALFDELIAVTRECPPRPTLFVDFANVRFDPSLGSVYKEMLARIRPLFSNVYRYNVPDDVSGTLTRSLLRTSNVGGGGSANVFEDEAAALKAFQAQGRAPSLGTR